MAAEQHPETAFYCVSDARYFFGAVALVNSLRMVGHREPIVVCDCGLTPRQREFLAPEVSFVDEPSGIPPWLLKTVAPLADPADVMVLIDADIIVTGRLDEPAAWAAEGAIAAVEHGSERFFESWASLLGLGALKRLPYVSSALVALPKKPGLRVLSLMQERRDAVDFEQTLWRRNVPDYPFLYADQDLLNAVLAAEIDGDELRLIDRRLEAIPPFEGLQLIDAATLRCAYEDGVEPLAIHHYTSKPWLEETSHGIYTELMERLLSGPDVALRVRQKDLPVPLQRGARGFLVRRLPGRLGSGALR